MNREISLGRLGQPEDIARAIVWLFSDDSFHATVNRTHAYRVVPNYFTPSDLGVNMANILPGFMGISVASGFSLGTGATNPGYFNSTAYQFSEDLNVIRGSHQIAFGINYIRAIMNTLNNRPTNGQFTFSSTTGCTGCTGLALAHFMVGTVSGGFVQGGQVYDNDRANFIGIYAQDSWKVSRRITLNYGVRWEPFLPENMVQVDLKLSRIFQVREHKTMKCDGKYSMFRIASI